MRLPVLLVAVLLALSALVVPTTSAHAATRTTATVLRWIDGDTVKTSRGTVRLIGVDTPERGKCGGRKATRVAKKLAPVGSRVRLTNPDGVRDKDKYGRALRYVNRAGRDVGATQIVRGAKARYDSRDGYQRHPRQDRYRRLDKKHANYKCASSGGGGTSGAVAPSGKNCPKGAPIKGNRSSMIYHSPGQRFYDVTVPEECFRDGASARAAGYRASKV